MNPVLLKPSSDIGAQVIIHGRARMDLDARAYHAYKPQAMAAVLESHERLKQAYEVVLVEGAGSPAEINLRDRDIANMGFAERVDCPVVLVADIDRGGVFAHLVGTLDCLSETERARVTGFIINRFRGISACWSRGSTGSPRAPASRCSACCLTCTGCISMPRTRSSTPSPPGMATRCCA